jgi:hypothetical protein
MKMYWEVDAQFRAFGTLVLSGGDGCHSYLYGIKIWG